LWTVQNLTNLLKNHEHLQDFPVKFEPIVPDLYPSTIADLEWQDMIAPEAEGFLAAAQRYVVTKGYYEPEEKSPAWIMVELFRPSIQRAVECAERYHDRMRSEQRKILGVSKKQFQTHAGSSRPAPESHMAMSFHVFLSHNSKDKPAVKQLGTELKERGLNPWLDEWELRPGLGWQDALEDIIKTCQSAAICVAENGIGPWEDPEMKALLRRFVNEKKSGNILPIIPVLLPGAPAKVRLPLFLEEYTWVDLRNGLTKEGLDMLIWGITGKKPGSLPAPQTIAAIEFTLDRPLSEFNEAKFRSAFQQATGIDAKFIRIASIRSGSTIVRIEASPDVLEEAIRQFQSAKGKLHEFSQLTGLTVMRWMIGGTEYELAVETSEAMAAPRVLARLQEEDRERDSVMSGFTLAFVTYQAVGALYDDDHSPHRDLIRTYRARVVSAAASLNLCSGGAPSDEAGRALINWLVATQDVNYNSARDLSVDAMLSIIDNFQKAQSKHVTARTTRKIEMIRCKVLFLAANPLDCDSLELDEEARAIEQRILQTNHRDAIDFVPKFAVRRDDLQFHLNKEQPHVLHFSGHGSKDEIAFKGNDGNAASVSKAGLKAMLKAVKDNIRLVVLNACYTRQQADSITDVIDCAIGMKRDIGDEAAQVFAASFYLAIGFGRSVQNAFDQAVAALQVMGIPEQKTPILSCRDGIDASNVFLVEATEKPANP
jgi:hypothetical protein